MFDIKRRAAILIVIIYLGFISLGLPDGILGVAWPAMRVSLSLPLEYMGIITTMLLCLSAFSSILSGHLIQRWGTGRLTAFSGLITGLGLLGYAFSPSFVWIVICSIPLGFGQGAVDSGLNMYVAENYTARHMSWLHCFWGLGASVGPFIMTWFLTSGNGWQSGYSAIASIQLSLTAILWISVAVGLWKREASQQTAEETAQEQQEASGLWQKYAQVLAVLLFFLYAGLEYSMGGWVNSVLVESRNIPVQTAGLSVTAYYASIMTGRFLTGFVVNRLGNIRMIRIGLGLSMAGALLCTLSGASIGVLIGVMLIGLGVAPVYPCLMHETPRRFRASIAQKLFGYQTGAACLGGSIISAGIGVLLGRFSMELLFPIAITLIVITMTINEILYRQAQKSYAIKEHL